MEHVPVGDAEALRPVLSADLNGQELMDLSLPPTPFCSCLGPPSYRPFPLPAGSSPVPLPTSLLGELPCPLVCDASMPPQSRFMCLLLCASLVFDSCQDGSPHDIN